MRRYLQGTLDYACGIYAVINALSCIHSIDLSAARNIFQEAMEEISSRPALWGPFLRNGTDHYWVVRYMLQRWCLYSPYRLALSQPFSQCLLESGPAFALEGAAMYLPEREDPSGPASSDKGAQEAERTLTALADWFAPRAGVYHKRKAAVLRFHRFVPGLPQPVVSHWTTACAADSDAVRLHDASGEQGAIFVLERRDLMPEDRRRPLLRIVPESVVFLRQ